ncbi:rad, Gem/Kir family member 3 isoform X2 [Rhynchophorus ferrugineus]|uniref:rad, Gem/Kir family member 3 isoform X2 n=1 Tax=Rhynchophorus ferrugineus TaxID=354439 RepID=UPI003FCE763D
MYFFTVTVTTSGAKCTGDSFLYCSKCRVPNTDRMPEEEFKDRGDRSGLSSENGTWRTTWQRVGPVSSGRLDASRVPASVFAMTDDRTQRVPRPKGRSASICAGSSSMEAIPPMPPPPGDGTPTQRRRRPAARSQSARIANRRSIKYRNAQQAQADRSQSNSEPKLTEDSTPDVSPNIRRKGSQRRGTSVYQRKSAAFLDVPESKKSTSHSNTDGEEDEDSYRLRSFSFTSKGIFAKHTGIINRGDSFRRRRSRSNSLCPPAMGGQTPSPVLDNHCIEVSNYTVALLGAQGVGKTALISQFMTSECINTYERQKDTLIKTETVSIMLNGEESELTFQNLGSSKEINRTNPPDAFVVLYSVVDKASFLKAEAELTRLQDLELLRSRPAIVAANKIDLARSRTVSTQDGKCLACTFKGKFIEISVGINHNVDELLVGILTQIRLKAENYDDSGPQQQYKSRGMVKASMKARQMFTWLFGKEDSKFKNCENLHIL